MPRRLAILTQGRTEPVAAKTAVSLLRFKPEEVVALIDTQAAGQAAGQVLGFGGDTPIVASLADAGTVDGLVIGVATAGGVLPEDMRGVVAEAIARGMTVYNGLHSFLSADPAFVASAAATGAELVDLRQAPPRRVADRQGIDETCYRVLTIGQDCSVGKMLVAYELTQALKQAEVDAKFAATGQTGILIEGDGVPMDAIVGDFIAGAAEGLVKACQSHEVVVVEGQASVCHASYSSVTLGLLHGSQPDGVVLCYEADRPHMHGRPDWPLPSLEQTLDAHLQLANVLHPCEAIGVAINSRRLDDAGYAREKATIQDSLGLPAVDVVREGCGVLVEAVQRHRAAIEKHAGKG